MTLKIIQIDRTKKLAELPFGSCYSYDGKLYIHPYPTERSNEYLHHTGGNENCFLGICLTSAMVVIIDKDTIVLPVDAKLTYEVCGEKHSDVS